MSRSAGKNWGNMSVLDGGRSSELRTHEEMDLERAQRALFVAMCGRDGKSISKDFRNVARGHVKLLRAFMRRVRQAKAARNDQHNYPLMKQSVAEIDAYVDRVFRMKQHTPDDRVA